MTRKHCHVCFEDVQYAIIYDDGDREYVCETHVDLYDGDDVYIEDLEDY